MTNIVRFPHNGPTVYDMMPDCRRQDLRDEALQLEATYNLISGEIDGLLSGMEAAQRRVDYLTQNMLSVGRRLDAVFREYHAMRQQEGAA